MKKGEKVRDDTERKKKTLQFWDTVLKDFKEYNIPPTKIAKMYVNPSTNKNYTPRHIYWILRQMGVII